jgi:hypothetical protein
MDGWMDGQSKKYLIWLNTDWLKGMLEIAACGETFFWVKENHCAVGSPGINASVFWGLSVVQETYVELPNVFILQEMLMLLNIDENVILTNYGSIFSAEIYYVFLKYRATYLNRY